MTNVWDFNVSTTFDPSFKDHQMRLAHRARRNSTADAHFFKTIAEAIADSREQIEELHREPMPCVSYKRGIAVWRNGKWARARRVSSSRMRALIARGR